MSSSPPEGQRRRSAHSFFQRLGFFKRTPKGKQVDYRERWPTVTTLLEQRSESGFFQSDPKPLKKPAKVRALERASISLQWIQDRIESVHDHLDHSIEVAEAKAKKRASLPGRPTAPGKSRHPYNTGVESHTREHAEEDDAASTVTVQRIETSITVEHTPARSQNKWLGPFTRAGKAVQPTHPPKPASPTPAASNASNEGTEEDITAGHLPRPQWKSAKDRRPSKYPDRKTLNRVDSSSDRGSSHGGLRPGSHHTTTPKGPSPEPSMRSSIMHSSKRPHHSRETSAESRERRRSASKKSTPGTTPRMLTPLSYNQPAPEPAHQQTARRISGQLVQAIGLLSPQSRSRTTSANRGMEHAQQQQPQQSQKRGAKGPTASGDLEKTSTSAGGNELQEQHHEDPATAIASPEISPTSLKSSSKSPKSGAFRHLLEVVKGGVPPSRAVSPLSMNGEEMERPKMAKLQTE